MRGRTMFQTVLATVTVAVAAAVLAAPASAATRCPAPFQVLHDDHIGAMSLPAGAYAITTNGLSCAAASALFSEFLEDYDGHLPTPWVANASRRSFTRSGTATGFSVRRSTFPPTPPSPPTPTRPVTCPATFSVLHNDRIGSVQFPRGAYRTTLQSGSINCQQASQLFASFLDDADGRLPGGWTVSSLTGSARGGRFVSPQGTVFVEQFTGTSTGGGGNSPNGSVACGPFRVLHNDNIGSLYLPRGTYNVYTLSADALSCSQATRQFTSFLNAASVPSNWVIHAATATFTRGSSGDVGFRIKPASTRTIR